MPRQALTNKAEPSGVEPVQRSKTALRIPPRARMRGETADLLRVECDAGVAHACDPPRSNGSLYGPMDRNRVCGDTLTRAMAGALWRNFLPDRARELHGAYCSEVWRYLGRRCRAHQKSRAA